MHRLAWVLILGLVAACGPASGGIVGTWTFQPGSIEESVRSDPNAPEFTDEQMDRFVRTMEQTKITFGEDGTFRQVVPDLPGEGTREVIGSYRVVDTQGDEWTVEVTVGGETAIDELTIDGDEMSRNVGGRPATLVRSRD